MNRDHHLTPERIGNVIRWATYGWMAALGLNTFQRKTDEGVPPQRAVEDAVRSAVYGVVLVAWHLFMLWMFVAKAFILIDWYDKHGQYGQGGLAGAVIHTVISIGFLLVVYPISTGLAAHDWADRCAWRIRYWRMYRYGAWLRDGRMSIGVRPMLGIAWIGGFLV